MDNEAQKLINLKLEEDIITKGQANFILKVHREAVMRYQLSTEQLNFYKENGYLVIRKLITQPALDSYRQRFLDVCNRKLTNSLVSVVKDRALCKPNSKPEEYINKIQELLYDEVFSTYSENPELLDIVSQLIGENICATNCMLINKPPGTTPHPPHQDLLYFPFRPAEKIVASWTAIDPVNKENGGLYMIPGSHKINMLLEHGDQAIEKKQFFHGVVNGEAIAPDHLRVYLEMSPGDTVVFHPCIVHGSLANTSMEYRKAMTCHYANSSCQYIEVRGSRHQLLAEQVENEMRRRGAELTCVDIWRIKMKLVRGVKCNL